MWIVCAWYIHMHGMRYMVCAWHVHGKAARVSCLQGGEYARHHPLEATEVDVRPLVEALEELLSMLRHTILHVDLVRDRGRGRLGVRGRARGSTHTLPPSGLVCSRLIA